MHTALTRLRSAERSEFNFRKMSGDVFGFKITPFIPITYLYTYVRKNKLFRSPCKKRHRSTGDGCRGVERNHWAFYPPSPSLFAAKPWRNEVEKTIGPRVTPWVIHETRRRRRRRRRIRGHESGTRRVRNRVRPFVCIIYIYFLVYFIFIPFSVKTVFIFLFFFIKLEIQTLIYMM